MPVEESRISSPMTGEQTRTPAEFRKKLPKTPLERILEGHDAVMSWEESGKDETVVTNEIYKTDFKYPMVQVERTWAVDRDTGSRAKRSEYAMVADHVMVKLKPQTGVSALDKLNQMFGATVRKKMYAPDMYIVKLAEKDLGKVKEMAAHFEKAAATIAYAEPDYLVYALDTVPDDTDFEEQWGMHNTGQTGGTADADIDAIEAWDISTGSSDVLVGVIDTGIDHTHPDLAANIWTNSGEIAGNGVDDDGNGFVDDVHGYDFYNDDGDPLDDHFHGTHCSGTIGAVGNNATGVVGVCWNVSIAGLKFLSDQGGGSNSDAVDAIYYATSIGCDITNNSWGGGPLEQTLFDAIKDAGEHDILFLAAAGNSAADNDVDPHYPGSYDCDNVIAVASTDHNDALSVFSSYGATTVDVAAPGTDILSTFPTYLTDAMSARDYSTHYGTLNGTSMSTPHVAGLCALLKSLMTDMNAAGIKERIMNESDPLAALDGKMVSGGRINAFQTMDVPNDPGLIYSSHVADDSAGNSDGFFNPGETIDLTLNLRNIGLDSANGVSAVLSIADSNVTVTDANATFGTILGYGATTEAQDVYTIEIDSDCPTPRELTFNLAISDESGGTWSGSFTVTTYTPSLISGTVTLDGAPLEGATVQYEGPLEGTATTAADGSYSINAIDGDYVLVVSKGDYVPTADTDVSTPPDVDVDFAFTTATISGAITDADTGDPIADAIVRYEGGITGQAVTAANGAYSITGVFGRTDTLTLIASKTGGYFDSNFVDVDVPPDQTVDFTLAMPDLEVSPMTLTVNASLGATTTRQLTIENTGSNNLEWSMPTDYVVVDSNDENGPAYDWIDISGTGTEIPGLGGDVNLGPFDIGFTFPFYGEDWTSFRVCSNGWIGFDSTWTSYLNGAIPYQPHAFPFLAIFWDNLSNDELSKGYYQQVDAETLVIQYQDFIFSWNELAGDRVTVQAILKASGEIYFQYKQVDYTLGCTVGIQEHGTNGIEVCYDEYYLHNEMAIRFVPVASWVSMSETSGSTGGGSTDTVTLTLDPDEAGLGTHETAVQVIHSNHSKKPAKTVLVTFNVTENPTNSAPVADDQSVTADEDTPKDITLTASDADGDPLTWSVGTPSHGALSGTAPNLTYTPDTGYTSSDSFTFTVNDGTVDSNTATVSITVQGAANQPPVIDSAAAADPDTIAISGTTTLTVTASDPDGDTLTYTWNKTSGPGTVTVTPNGTTASNSATAGFDAVGSYEIEVVVTDGNGGSVSDSVTVTVTDEPNEAPVIDTAAAITPDPVTIPNTASATVSAYDADGDTLTYAWSKDSGPGTASFNPNGTTAANSTTVSFNAAGDYTLRVTVSDGTDDVSDTVTITVNADPGAGAGRIQVLGNGVEIADGDTTPDIADHTDFGAAYEVDGTVVRTFTISNTGTASLSLNGDLVAIGGADAADFSVTTLPAASITAGGSTTFEITFDPSSEGAKQGTVTIESDDSTLASFDFAIAGDGLAGSAPAIAPPPSDDDDGCSVGFGGSNLLVMLIMLLVTRIARRGKRS